MLVELLYLFVNEILILIFNILYFNKLTIQKLKLLRQPLLFNQDSNYFVKNLSIDRQFLADDPLS